MIKDNDTNTNKDSSPGANSPVSVDKIKEYGKKAYGPLLNVLHKYQDEFAPYLNALAKGLQGGVDSLTKEGASGPEKYVSQFFQEAADGVNEASRKLESRDVNELSNYLSNVAEERPGLIFSTSYVVGIFFGRLAKNIITKQSSSSVQNMKGANSKFDQSIH
jgi:hypothetical protein